MRFSHGSLSDDRQALDERPQGLPLQHQNEKTLESKRAIQARLRRGDGSLGAFENQHQRIENAEQEILV